MPEPQIPRKNLQISSNRFHLKKLNKMRNIESNKYTGDFTKQEDHREEEIQVYS